MQIDFIMRRTMHKLVIDVSDPWQGSSPATPKIKHKFTPRLKVWKRKDPQTSNHFQEVFNLHVSTSVGVADGATEDSWNNIKTGLLKTTEEVKPGGGMNM